MPSTQACRLAPRRRLRPARYPRRAWRHGDAARLKARRGNCQHRRRRHRWTFWRNGVNGPDRHHCPEQHPGGLRRSHGGRVLQHLLGDGCVIEVKVTVAAGGGTLGKGVFANLHMRETLSNGKPCGDSDIYGFDAGDRSNASRQAVRGLRESPAGLGPEPQLLLRLGSPLAPDRARTSGHAGPTRNTRPESRTSTHRHAAHVHRPQHPQTHCWWWVPMARCSDSGSISRAWTPALATRPARHASIVGQGGSGRQRRRGPRARADACTGPGVRLCQNVTDGSPPSAADGAPARLGANGRRSITSILGVNRSARTRTQTVLRG